MFQKYFIFKKILCLINNIYSDIITLIYILIYWQSILYIFNIPNYLIPTPLNIFHYILQYHNTLLSNAIVTIAEAMCGLVLAIIISIILGVVALYSHFFIQMIYKTLLLIQIIPLMAIAPLIIIWLGFGITAKILIVFIVCVFPCLVAFLRGSKNIDNEYIYLLQTMGANSWQIFKIIIFPSSCYSLFSGLKIAVTYSVTSAVIAEYLGAEKGIGIYITRAISSFDNNALFTNILLIIFITLIFYKILLIIEKYLLPWNNNTKKESHEIIL